LAIHFTSSQLPVIWVDHPGGLVVIAIRAFIHTDGANYTFADGHAKWLSSQNPHLLLTVSNRNKTGMVALPNSLWKFNKPRQRLVLTGT